MIPRMPLLPLREKVAEGRMRGCYNAYKYMDCKDILIFFLRRGSNRPLIRRKGATFSCRWRKANCSPLRPDAITLTHARDDPVDLFIGQNHRLAQL